MSLCVGCLSRACVLCMVSEWVSARVCIFILSNNLSREFICVHFFLFCSTSDRSLIHVNSCWFCCSICLRWLLCALRNEISHEIGKIWTDSRFEKVHWKVFFLHLAFNVPYERVCGACINAWMYCLITGTAHRPFGYPLCSYRFGWSFYKSFCKLTRKSERFLTLFALNVNRISGMEDTLPFLRSFYLMTKSDRFWRLKWDGGQTELNASFPRIFL